MKHAFQSAKSDGGDATIVKPSNWNDSHVYSRTAISSNTSINSTHDLVEMTTGGGGITATLPDATTVTAGKPYKFIKVDSGAGAGTIATTGGQTINGNSTYSLVEQWQHVEVYSDGSNWKVIGGN